MEIDNFSLEVTSFHNEVNNEYRKNVNIFWYYDSGSKIYGEFVIQHNLCQLIHNNLLEKILMPNSISWIY